MKKFITRFLSLSLAAALAFCVVTAEAKEVSDDDSGFYAVVSLSSGEEETVADIPDSTAELLEEDAQSYELFYENERVLSVELNAAAPSDDKTYSVGFTLPNTSKYVFLAGLSASKTDEIQQKLIESYSDGSNFTITDLEFIDAEKTDDEDDDDDLCWAATSANMLVYSGWAAQAGFSSEDDVFEAMIDSFENKGGHAYYGIGWFINGVNTFERYNPNAASVVDYPNSGAYLTDYSYDVLAYSVSVDDDYTTMYEVFDRLSSGYAVGVDVKIYDTVENDEYYGGHAITLFGYVVDKAYTPDDPDYYDMIIVADSDSDQLKNRDRREADNKLYAYSLYPYSDDMYNSLCYYDDDYRFVIYSSVYLRPYSDDVEKETSSKATRSLINTKDISIPSCYLSDDPEDYVFCDAFDSGADIYFAPILQCSSDLSFSDRVDFNIKVTDSNGVVRYDRSFSSNVELDVAESVSFSMSSLKVSDLEDGVYTLTMSADPNKKLTQAYYYNDTYKCDFTVGVPPYTFILGDANGDSKVTVLDATLIQRVLAKLTADEDGKISLRGNVRGNGELSVLDATALQRSLAKLSTVYPIGEYKTV